MKKTQFYKLFGGLGNQLFQYAYGLGQIENGEKLRFILNKDASTRNSLSINELFEIDNSLIIAPKSKIGLNFYKFYAKYLCKTWHADFFQEYGFAENLNKLQKSPKFGFKKIELYEKSPESAFIKAKNAVSLHIRGGDYNRIDVFRDFGNICNLEYYRNAIKTVCAEIADPVFIIFTNDAKFAHNFIEEIKKDEYFLQNSVNFLFLNEICESKKAQELQNNSAKTKKDDAFELYLQSICKANIIANSTYSWWGAFFNQNPEKIVISPKKWHNSRPQMIDDLVPNRCNWRKI